MTTASANNPQLLLVIYDSPGENNNTRKLRIRQSDLPDDDDVPRGRITGKQLYAILTERVVCADPRTTASIINIDIYDPRNQCFQSLNEDEQDDDGDINIARKFGKCVRCMVTFRTVPPTKSSSSDNDAQRLGQHPALMGRYFPYDSDEGLEISGITVRVQETPNIPGGGTGLNVWDGAVLLSRYLEQRTELVKAKRVLELGAGCGLVGITAAILGAAHVTLTDLSYCLPLLEANVNRHRAVATERGCRELNCCVCDWYEAPPTSLTELGEAVSFDVILAADCVWLQELVQPLLNTLEKLVTANSCPQRVIVSYQRRGKAAHEAFWNGIHKLFSVVRDIDTLSVGIEKPDCLHVLECYNITIE